MGAPRAKKDYEAIAKKTGLSTWQIMGMVCRAVSHPAAYRLLKANNFVDSQIPGWFWRQDPTPKPDKAVAPLSQATSLKLPAAKGLAPLGEGLVDASASTETPPIESSSKEIEQAPPSLEQDPSSQKEPSPTPSSLPLSLEQDPSSQQLAPT